MFRLQCALWSRSTEYALHVKAFFFFSPHTTNVTQARQGSKGTFPRGRHYASQTREEGEGGRGERGSQLQIASPARAVHTATTTTTARRASTFCVAFCIITYQRRDSLSLACRRRSPPPPPPPPLKANRGGAANPWTSETRSQAAPGEIMFNQQRLSSPYSCLLHPRRDHDKAHSEAANITTRIKQTSPFFNSSFKKKKDNIFGNQSRK